MDLEEARKALSKRNAFSSKRIAFFVVAGLCLVAGIALRSGQYFSQQEVEQTAPVAAPPQAAATPPVEPTESIPQTQTPLGAPETATAPNEPAAQTGVPVEQAEQPGEPVEQADQPGIPDSNMILVSKRPVAVLASPSSSAPALYGLPAGRPFRLIGRDGSFAHIQDLKSSASGWIDEAALAPPPRVPSVSAPSQTNPVVVGRKPANASGDQKPKATNNGGQVAADSDMATQPDRSRPGLFGRGGLFGDIFNNGN